MLTTITTLKANCGCGRLQIPVGSSAQTTIEAAEAHVAATGHKLFFFGDAKPVESIQVPDPPKTRRKE